MCESVRGIKKKRDLAGFRIVSVFTAHDNPQCDPLRFKEGGKTAYCLKSASLKDLASKVKPSSRDYARFKQAKSQTELGIMTPSGEVFVFSDFDNLDSGPVSLVTDTTITEEVEWPGPPF